MSAKTQAWIDMVGTILFLIPFSLLMLYVSYPAVQASWSVREASPDPGGLPRYPIKALILVSFTLLLLQAFSQLVKQVDVIRGVVPELDHHEGEPEPHL
jgi:TRAP-type mannitol/chloroaromatic compound transport system permease small subunit